MQMKTFVGTTDCFIQITPTCYTDLLDAESVGQDSIHSVRLHLSPLQFEAVDSRPVLPQSAVGVVVKLWRVGFPWGDSGVRGHTELETGPGCLFHTWIENNVVIMFVSVWHLVLRWVLFISLETEVRGCRLLTVVCLCGDAWHGETTNQNKAVGQFSKTMAFLSRLGCVSNTHDHTVTASLFMCMNLLFDCNSINISINKQRWASWWHYSYIFIYNANSNMWSFYVILLLILPLSLFYSKQLMSSVTVGTWSSWLRAFNSVHVHSAC